VGALFGFFDTVGRHMQEQNRVELEHQTKANAEMADMLDNLAKTAKPQYAPDYFRAAMQIRMTPPGKKPPKEATDIYSLMLRQVKSPQPTSPTQSAQPTQPVQGRSDSDPNTAFVDPSSTPSLMPPPGMRTEPASGAGMASLLPPPSTSSSTSSSQAAPMPTDQPAPGGSSMPTPPPGYGPPPGYISTQVDPIEMGQYQMQVKQQMVQQERNRLAQEAMQLFPNDPYARANYINDKTVDQPSTESATEWIPSGMPGVALNKRTGEYKAYTSDQPLIKDVAPGHHVISIDPKSGTSKPVFNAPPSDSNLSYQEQIHRDYQAALQGDLAAKERVAAHLIRMKQEAIARGAPLEARRSLDIALLSRLVNPAKASTDLPPNLNSMLDDVARRVASGEMSLAQAQQAMGGQRAGLGGAILSRLSETDARILPAQVRTKITDVNIGMGELEIMEQLTEQVINSPSTADRAANTLLLENYTKSLASRLARANGEVGVLTDQDVNRAMTLVPGWKAANFAPEFARRELQLLRSNYDRVKTAFTNQYFEQFSRGGGVPTLAPTPSPSITPPPSRPTPAPTPTPKPIPPQSNSGSTVLMEVNGQRFPVRADAVEEAIRRGARRVQ